MAPIEADPSPPPFPDSTVSPLGHKLAAEDPDYRWWESEIDYSRLYMAGHVVSDLKGGGCTGGGLRVDAPGDPHLMNHRAPRARIRPWLSTLVART